MMVRNSRQTRQRLLKAAFEEIHQHGFQGMRVDEVLRKTGLQKGAFYHHFKSKVELAYAVLEEQVGPAVESVWITPLPENENPMTSIPKLMSELADHLPATVREHGCPLNNLAQEMAALDEGFQSRILDVFNHWIQAYTQLFTMAQNNNMMRADVNANEVARFVVATLEGSISVTKAERSPAQWRACQAQLERYLNGLST